MSFTLTGPTLNLTIDQWCEQLLRNHLDRNETSELDKLSGAVVTTGTSMTVQYGANLRPQTRAEIGTELVHVWAVATTDTFTIERGILGSAPASHADGDLIRINPRFPKIVLAEHLRREIRAWPVSIFAITSGLFSPTNGTEVIDLDGLGTAENIRLLRVQHDHEREANGAWPVVRNARLEVRQDATDFPSTVALHLGGVTHSGGPFQVAVGYKHPTDQSTIDFSADVGETFHLNSALADAAMVGVAGMLLLADEVDRTNDLSQGRPRRAEEIPPGHRLQAGQALLAQRDHLLKMEHERITNEYGPSFA